MVIADRILEIYLFVEMLLPILKNTDESIRIIGSQRIDVGHPGLGFCTLPMYNCEEIREQLLNKLH